MDGAGVAALELLRQQVPPSLSYPRAQYNIGVAYTILEATCHKVHAKSQPPGCAHAALQVLRELGNLISLLRLVEDVMELEDTHATIAASALLGAQLPWSSETVHGVGRLLRTPGASEAVLAASQRPQLVRPFMERLQARLTANATASPWLRPLSPSRVLADAMHSLPRTLSVLVFLHFAAMFVRDKDEAAAARLERRKGKQKKRKKRTKAQLEAEAAAAAAPAMVRGELVYGDGLLLGVGAILRVTGHWRWFPTLDLSSHLLRLLLARQQSKDPTQQAVPAAEAAAAEFVPVAEEGIARLRVFLDSLEPPGAEGSPEGAGGHDAVPEPPEDDMEVALQDARRSSQLALLHTVVSGQGVLAGDGESKS
mmetsp:Transcript_20541/g.65787  ORF Transcript_20541/g.65787 Transcript_20541/m.65787 type:complete len:368 (+) Transcript_20541:371-1474(+)